MTPRRNKLAAGVMIALVLAIVGCSKPSAPAAELKHYPMERLDGIMTTSGVALDNEVASGGSSSLRITAAKPGTIRLFQTGDIDVEGAKLIYQAKVRTRDVKGKVYLEMWCEFAGKGEFFSRGLESILTGTAEWSTLETPFFLKAGENPDNIRLNLVIEATGTVWIDDIRLLSGPLK